MMNQLRYQITFTLTGAVSQLSLKKLAVSAFIPRSFAPCTTSAMVGADIVDADALWLCNSCCNWTTVITFLVVITCTCMHDHAVRPSQPVINENKGMNLKDITVRLIYEFNTSLTLSNKQALPPLVLILNR